MDPESNSDSMMTGALIRASSADRSPFLLDKQELHKLIVLIIADDKNASVGVVLNWPSSKGLDIKVAGKNTGVARVKTIPLDPPEQFQTTKKKLAMEMLPNFDPQDPPSSDDEEEEPQLWLECAAQREAVIGYKNLVEKAREWKGFDSMSLMQRHVVQWYQGLRDDIETWQKWYMSSHDTWRGKKRYGPFLHSLHPKKMAVITSHEAITQALFLFSRKNGMTVGKNARSDWCCGEDWGCLSAFEVVVGSMSHSSFTFDRRLLKLVIIFTLQLLA
jgi:hypothetical protein